MAARTSSFAMGRPGRNRKNSPPRTQPHATSSATACPSPGTTPWSEHIPMMTVGVVIVVVRTSSFAMGRPGRNNKNSPPRMRPQVTSSATACPSPGTTPWSEHMPMMTLGVKVVVRTSSFAMGRLGRNNKNSPLRMRPRLTSLAAACPSPGTTPWSEHIKMLALGVVVVVRTSSFAMGRLGRNRKNSPPQMRPQVTTSAPACPSPGTTPWSEHMPIMTLGVKVVVRTSSFAMGRLGRNNKNSPPRMRPQVTSSATACPSPGTTPWSEHMAMMTLGVLVAARTSSSCAATRPQLPPTAASGTARVHWRLGIRASRRVTAGTRCPGRARVTRAL